MKKRQLKKIMNLYVMDADDDILIPPSVYRPEERAMEIYFSKAWQVSHPEEAKKLYEEIEKLRDNACTGTCGNCEGNCDCEKDNQEGCCCGPEGCSCKKN